MEMGTIGGSEQGSRSVQVWVSQPNSNLKTFNRRSGLHIKTSSRALPSLVKFLISILHLLSRASHVRTTLVA